MKEHSFLHYHFVKDTQQKKKTDAKNETEKRRRNSLNGQRHYLNENKYFYITLIKKRVSSWLTKLKISDWI